MSLAWATVVVAILLTPGAFFFAGLYAPQAVSRETLAISPLGQLAGIVCTSFFLHGIFYLVINDGVSRICPWIPPVDLSSFFPVLHADNGAVQEVRATSTGIASHVGNIIVYFAFVDAAGVLVGLLVGLAIENQVRVFSRLARHPWLYEIRGPNSSSRAGRTVIAVSALSKVQDSGQVILYEGQLSHIYVKADGAISYVTLVSAASSVVAIPTRVPAAASDSPVSSGTPFTPGAMTRGVDWPLQQNSEVDKSLRHKSDMLFLPGSEINNFYLERRVWESDKLTKIERNKLLEKGRKALADAGISDKSVDA
ncbi:hypothetical protein G3O06_10340 [Burkholderia sp. Ac-20345]|uniref:hypothetical protein n=1 Tax=Burkholderia sp. Ac-20345 TaxID=2703891 RepID=UPI00197B74CB|nr:hypothetical protein [Burkholderia sp. Ac-20345]MBN3777952.1 hypothetical protein [Burkholderia sp. Ac-20345]